MAIVRGATGTGSDYGGSSSAALTTAAYVLTAGNLSIVTWRFASAVSVSSVTDTAGNTYTVRTTVTSGSGTRLGLAYALNCAGHASNVATVNLSAASQYWGVCAGQYSGAATASGFDVEASGTSASGGHPTSGSFTPTEANEVGVSACQIDSAGGTWTAGTGYSIAVQDASQVLMLQDQIGLAVSSQTADATHTNVFSVNPSIVVATFKEASSGSTPSPGAGALVLSGKTPSTVMTWVASCALGALTLQGLAPTVTIGGGNVTPTPAAGTLTLTGYAPTPTLALVPSPSAGTLTLSGQIPTLTISSGPAPTPPTGTLTLSGLAPTLTRVDQLAPSPSTGALVLQGYAPSLAYGGTAGVRIVAGTSTITLLRAGDSTVTLAITGTSTAGG